ncbi:hypothetical protein FISHEDRAFT_33477 [Fistulina hepatica ATCC 64428]|uniref:Uncharacterized protein n=1 Tax=Fistulina hepatica ATCC 64428 TaxID=1128425 RepID=A0A0D7APA3_9AGAR|nr:hypothetical protein FISHEDRAFT_33477 [Fistulina hepatica ATCC 64428]
MLLALLATFATGTALLARADVSPSDPSPGAMYYEGKTCHVSWEGDTSTDSKWGSMVIELMTGSNNAMVHLTTVASNQDGTKSGSYSYPCPSVHPNAEIYFYQFSAAAATDHAWTGRFIIATADGLYEAPSHNTSDILWGIGALNDPSDASALPSWLSGFSATTTDSATTAGPATGSHSSTSVASTSTAMLNTTSTAHSTTKAVTKSAISKTATSTTATSATATSAAADSNSVSSNNAVSMSSMWHVATTLFMTVVTFAALL